MLKLTVPTGRTLIIAGAAGLVVVALAAGGWYWHTVSRRHAMAAYADAMTRAQPALTPQATADAKPRGSGARAALTHIPRLRRAGGL
jgi:hypothetical protein